MATLNLIADELSGALNRPFDSMLKQRLKSIFRHEAATMIRQSIDKVGVDDIFRTRFRVRIAKVTDNTLVGVHGDKWFRTIYKVPRPIRYKTDEPFLWVGSDDGKTIFIYSRLTEIQYGEIQPAYVGNTIESINYKPIRYIWQNDYIYIYNYLYTTSGISDIIVPGIDPGNDEAEDIPYITIEGPFGINDIITPEDELSSIVVTDDTELPLPEDLIQAIKLKLLSGELRVTDSKDIIPPSHTDNN